MHSVHIILLIIICLQLKLKNFADRVNLGLIPSSEEGWPVACAALKRSTGGWLHIHGNVSTYTKPELQTSTAASCKEGDRGREQLGAESNPWTKTDRKVDVCVDDLTHCKFMILCYSEYHKVDDKVVKHILIIQGEKNTRSAVNQVGT